MIFALEIRVTPRTWRQVGYGDADRAGQFLDIIIDDEDYALTYPGTIIERGDKRVIAEQAEGEE